MEPTAWIALAGVVLTNGGVLLASVVRHAKTEERVRAKIVQLEVDLDRGARRFEKLEEGIERLNASMGDVNVKLAGILTELRVRNGHRGGSAPTRT